jgi:hypothetical protein
MLVAGRQNKKNKKVSFRGLESEEQENKRTERGVALRRNQRVEHNKRKLDLKMAQRERPETAQHVYNAFLDERRAGAINAYAILHPVFVILIGNFYQRLRALPIGVNAPPMPVVGVDVPANTVNVSEFLDALRTAGVALQDIQRDGFLVDNLIITSSLEKFWREFLPPRPVVTSDSDGDHDDDAALPVAAARGRGGGGGRGAAAPPADACGGGGGGRGARAGVRGARAGFRGARAGVRGRGASVRGLGAAGGGWGAAEDGDDGNRQAAQLRRSKRQRTNRDEA